MLVTLDTGERRIEQRKHTYCSLRISILKTTIDQLITCIGAFRTFYNCVSFDISKSVSKTYISNPIGSKQGGSGTAT